MLRVATFNVHRCVGRDGILDIERTVRAIAAARADVVALQELDRNMARTRRLDQPTLLGRMTGMEVGFVPTLRRGPGRYGIALATTSRVDLCDERLPRRGREEPRRLILAHLGGVWVLATHLATEGAARTRQIAALADKVASLEGPVVLLGDLNASARELGPLLDVGLHAGPRSATFRRRQIDHILVGRGLRIARAWAVPTDASDHRPLVADVRP